MSEQRRMVGAEWPSRCNSVRAEEDSQIKLVKENESEQPEQNSLIREESSSRPENDCLSLVGPEDDRQGKKSLIREEKDRRRRAGQLEQSQNSHSRADCRTRGGLLEQFSKK